MRAAFAIGFVILFVFTGTFACVNLELSRVPLSPSHLGFVYPVFLPAMVTTSMAGRAVRRWGARPTLCAALIGCVAALPMLLSTSLMWVLAALALLVAFLLSTRIATPKE